jgi:hypothetical protein
VIGSAGWARRPPRRRVQGGRDWLWLSGRLSSTPGGDLVRPRQDVASSGTVTRNRGLRSDGRWSSDPTSWLVQGPESQAAAERMRNGTVPNLAIPA